MSEFGLSYKVDTSWSNDLISQDVIEDFNGIRRTMWTNVLKLQDQGVREALIRLGWTPPPDNSGCSDG